MKIIRLQAENFKKVTVIDITPIGDVVDITGPNASGKSTVLDCIPFAMEGANNLTFPKPLKEGTKHGFVELEVDGFVIKRTITPSGTKLEVRRTAGDAITEAIKSPQAVLDSFLGKYTFDPLAFFDLTFEQQRAEILDMLGVSGTVLDFNTKIKDLKLARSAEVTKVNYAKAALPHSAPEEAAEQELSEELLAKLTYSSNIARVREAEAACISDIGVLKTQLENKQKALVLLQNEIQLADAEPFQAVKDRIDGINENNIKANEFAAYSVSLQAIQALNANIDQFDTDILTQKQGRDAAVAAAEMPIVGMTISDKGIHLNNIPLKQISSAEQMKVCVYLAMRLNPELKVIRIANGSLLDASSKQVIVDLARKFNYQIWIETVSDDQDFGFYLEAGEIAGKEKHEK